MAFADEQKRIKALFNGISNGVYDYTALQQAINECLPNGLEATFQPQNDNLGQILSFMAQLPQELTEQQLADVVDCVVNHPLITGVSPFPLEVGNDDFDSLSPTTPITFISPVGVLSPIPLQAFVNASPVASAATDAKGGTGSSIKQKDNRITLNAGFQQSTMRTQPSPASWGLASILAEEIQFDAKLGTDGVSASSHEYRMTLPVVNALGGSGNEIVKTPASPNWHLRILGGPSPQLTDLGIAATTYINVKMRYENGIYIIDVDGSNVYSENIGLAPFITLGVNWTLFDNNQPSGQPQNSLFVDNYKHIILDGNLV